MIHDEGVSSMITIFIFIRAVKDTPAPLMPVSIPDLGLSLAFSAKKGSTFWAKQPVSVHEPCSPHLSVASWLRPLLGRLQG